MANLFDSTNYPLKVPDTLIAGDRIVWKRTDLGSDYPSATYSLGYSARSEGTTSYEISITTTASGTDYLVQVAAATSAQWIPGRYQWQAYIVRTSDGERVTVGAGMFEVKTNADKSDADTRSHARITLTNLETAIQALSSKTSSSYTINGRSMTYADLTELERLRATYESKVKAEDRRTNGTGGGKLVVRFR